MTGRVPGTRERERARACWPAPDTAMHVLTDRSHVRRTALFFISLFLLDEVDGRANEGDPVRSMTCELRTTKLRN